MNMTETCRFTSARINLACFIVGLIIVWLSPNSLMLTENTCNQVICLWYMNFYPPGGFVNLINKPYMPMSSQPLGENFQFVGLTQNFDTSPLPAPSAKRTPKPPRLAKETIEIDGDGDAATEETKAVKKRYWTHDEEVRLVIPLSKPSHIYKTIRE
jgi:hypothetical protein